MTKSGRAGPKRRTAPAADPVAMSADEARALAMAKAAGADRTTTNKYAEQLVRHVRETGRLIAELPRGKGGRGKTEPSDWLSFIDKSGFCESTAKNWQALATHITDIAFDERIESLKADDEAIIALSEFYDLVKTVRRVAKESSRQQMRDENARQIESLPSIDTVSGLFTTLMVDPPWDWGDEGDADQLGRARPQYEDDW